MNRYKETGRTLTASLELALTTSRTRNPVAEMSHSVRMDNTKPTTQIDVVVNNQQPFILPQDAVKNCISIAAPNRVLVLHRATAGDEFMLLSVCTGMFLVMGSIPGQLAIQGDYAEDTLCNLFYS